MVNCPGAAAAGTSSSRAGGLRRKFAAKRGASMESKRQSTLDSSDDEPKPGILELSPERAIAAIGQEEHFELPLPPRGNNIIKLQQHCDIL